jgi:hypothetical protein
MLYGVSCLLVGVLFMALIGLRCSAKVPSVDGLCIR